MGGGRERSGYKPEVTSLSEAMAATFVWSVEMEKVYCFMCAPTNINFLNAGLRLATSLSPDELEVICDWLVHDPHVDLRVSMALLSALHDEIARECTSRHCAV